MIRALLVALSLLFLTDEDVAAQLRNSGSVDTSISSQITSLQAQIPTRCASVPIADTLMGSLQSGTKCYTSYNDTRPTLVQAAVVSTDASGNWSVTWGKAFSGATPYINAQAVNLADTQPYTCNVASSTTTSAQGRCWKTQTMTLPGVATALLNLVLNPTASTGVISVRVAGRDTTQ